jgi:hypothetical protein
MQLIHELPPVVLACNRIKTKHTSYVIMYIYNRHILDFYITKMEEVLREGSAMLLCHNGIQGMPPRDKTITPLRQVVNTSMEH